MKIVAVGDIGVDIYTNRELEKPGGIGFNFIYNVIQNGMDGSLVSVIGNDANGDTIVRILRTTDINASHVRVAPGLTPTQKIILKDNGERKFVGYDPGVLEHWALTKEELSFIGEHDAVFVPLSDGMKHIFEDIAYMKTKTIKVADFSQDSEYADFDKEDNSITHYSSYFDINFVGATEKEIPLLQKLSRHYKDKLYILTLGKKGSIAFLSGKEYLRPAEKLEKIIDTTGAGDAFQASFVVSYLQTKDLKQSLTLASKSAAKVISHIGSTPILL